jgi:RNA-directed DNA polymerase
VKRRGEGEPEVFDILGLVRKTRKTGRFIVKQTTIRKRLSAKLSELKEELQRHWRQPAADVGKWLKSVVQSWIGA